jgi:hypothetical protein
MTATMTDNDLPEDTRPPCSKPRELTDIEIVAEKASRVAHIRSQLAKAIRRQAKGEDVSQEITAWLRAEDFETAVDVNVVSKETH